MVALRIGSFDRRAQENWIFRAFAIFIVGLTLWILVALTLTSADAGSLSLLADLSSKLKASYGIDLFGNSMGSLQLSIIEDAWRDGGGAGEGSADPEGLLALLGGSPVPTATPADGDPRTGRTPAPTATLPPSSSPTATPTPSATATETSSPTPTATETDDGSGGSDEPTPTATPEPTKKNNPKATDTPEPTDQPTEVPSEEPTEAPTAIPTEEPTEVPSEEPPPLGPIHPES